MVMELNNIVSKRKATSLTSAYYIVKVTGIKPGAANKWRNMLVEKYPDTTWNSEVEIEQNIIGEVRIVKQVGVINNIKNEYHMLLGWYNDVVVEYSDLEYEVYKVVPNPIIEKLNVG
jgi:hypothetical protein